VRMDRGSWVVGAVVAFAVMVSAPVSAGAVTFGTNLELPANFPAVTCGAGVPNQSLFTFFPPYSGSCMWSSIVVGSASESLTAPGTGTVTTVRVKTGANAGPMQINVVRFLFRQTGNSAQPELDCCFVEAYGPEFIPAANTVTTVPTNLPVVVEPTPPPEDTHTIAATDQLVLSSLNPNVQVPLFATKNGGKTTSAFSATPGIRRPLRRRARRSAPLMQFRASRI